MKRFVVILLIGFFLSGCAPIEHTTTIEQRIGQPYIAGVGDVVIRIEKKETSKTLLEGPAFLAGKRTKVFLNCDLQALKGMEKWFSIEKTFVL